MVFHWSLSDNKPLQVSRTLLSILADLNNAVVWMVSTCPLISKSFSPYDNPLEIVPSAPITIGNTVIFMFYDFLVLWQSLGNLSFCFLLFLLSGSLRQQVHCFFCWLSLGLVVSPKLDDLFVSQGILCLILQDRFWIVHIPLVGRVTFKFLAQFPVDYLPF